MTFVTRILACGLLCLVATASSALELDWDLSGARPLGGGSSGGDYYDYAPSSILDGGIEYHFYCSNKDTDIVSDHIALTQVLHADGSIVADKRIVLAPTPGTAWDSIHVCDPDVVRGEFRYEGITYSWAMFYLGCGVMSCTRNQIGLAFAQNLSGPWVKYSGNPVIPFASYDWWGVGESSSISVDDAGKVTVFYTQGDQAGTRILKQELDLSDMSAPSIGPASTVTTSGLSDRYGDADVFNNADFAYDSRLDKFIVTRDRHPFDTTTPNFVTSEFQIACIDGAALRAGGGTWQVLSHVNIGRSSKARNHNSGLLRGPYGTVAEPGKLKVIFCGSDEAEGWDWLWSYRLHAIQGTLRPYPDLADSDGDGLSNIWETMDLAPATPGVQNPFNPSLPDSTGNNGDPSPDGIADGRNDWDGDGMSNANEFLWGDNPIDPESYTERPSIHPLGLSILFLIVLGHALARMRRQSIPA